jgi:hypothetical protein
MVVMTLLLIVGSTSAGPASTSAGSALADVKAGPLCFDQVSYCNDYIVMYAAGGGGFYHVVGKEYGCGQQDRQANGSIEYKDGILWVELDTHSPTSSGAMPLVGTFDAQVNYGSKTGPSQWAWHTDTYWWGTDTAQLVPCPKDLDAITPDGPDSALSR